MSKETGDIPDCLVGYFLISEVNLADPNFHRTVVLIIDHDEDGAFGLVVNRKLHLRLGEVIAEFTDSAAGELAIYQGGPVQPQYLFSIHSGLPSAVHSEHSSDPIEHVTFEPAFPHLAEYLKTNWGSMRESSRPPVNLYAGYSGWSSGQLESELERDA